MKTVTLKCPQHAAMKLGHCLQHYADAAYPPGASECAQASRAALFGAAESILTQSNNDSESIDISRRLRTNIKAALTYCEQQSEDKKIYQQLLKTLSGEAVSKDEWL